jgi:hypothetical protein
MDSVQTPQRQTCSAGRMLTMEVVKKNSIRKAQYEISQNVDFILKV